MIEYKEEKLGDFLEEIKTLLPDHYDELSVSKMFPLSPNYDLYLELQKTGNLVCITARDSGVLVGYILFIVTPHLHYKSCMTAVEDIYFVRKDYRKGRTGIKLFQFAEKYLKEQGVHRVIFGTKVHLDNSKLFEYLGYTFFEKLYTKLI